MSELVLPVPRRSGIRRALPVALALLALLLAGGGEYVIRSGNSSGLGLALYLAAIALFAWKAWPPPAAPGAAPPAAARPGLRLALLLGGLLGVAALTALEVRLLLRDDLKGAEAPWAAAILLLLLAAAFSGPVTAFAPQWSLPPLAGRFRKTAFAAAVVAILVLAAATRLPALDRIPYGINADEGDQAMVAIQLLRGTRDDSLFGVGWYHIGMMYFHSLAAVMRFSGISIGGARVFGALCGIATAGIVLVLGVRNFGRRAGLLAGTLAATIGPALQFSRETTCAGPTITLWTASAAFFLEAARTGRAWAWALAGLSGGASIYFYPTGRLWGVVAALFTLGLIARGERGTRGRLVAGTALAATAAFVVMTPFLQMIARNPGLFVVRARETSIFVPENPRRLGYYDPSWSTAKLVAVQLEHAVGILDRYPDGNYFWPTGKPILPPALAALTLLGLGASLLKVRDVRFLLLTAWFWLGFVGVVVTVETPNLHRMSTAVPVLALFAALVLDDTARRLSALAAGRAPRVAAAITGGIGAVAGLVVLALAGRELDFYFRHYAKADAWPSPRAEGQGVAAMGPGAWALSLGREFHMVNSGWIYLYAPDVLRGGVLAPGSYLPVPLPANRDLGFVVYARQPFYLPLLKEIYPGGETIRVTHPPDVHVYDVYRVPRAAWAARQGALAERPGAAPVRVPALGAPPPGAAPGPMRWAATLRVPRFWNYGFRIGPGPARLSIDGRPILDLPRGRAEAAVAVHLAQGEHHLVLDGEVDRGGAGPAVGWAMADESGALGDVPAWEAIPTPRLVPEASPPGGLFVRLLHEGRPEIRRRDRTIATGGIGEEIPWSAPFRALWSGQLRVPETGTYRMTFEAQGEIELALDGRVVFRKETNEGGRASGDVALTGGTHELEIRYEARSLPGFLEWRWRPPSGVDSIVPPSVLAPPPGAGVGPPEPIAVIGPGPLQPREKPVVLRW
jgi:hypothetical protein